MAPAARRWDFTSGSSSGASSSASSSASAVSVSSNVMVEPPFGYTKRGAGGQVVESAAAGKASIEELNKEKAMKQRMAMEIAQAPAKGLLMQGFMMYMTGNSVSIISIMIVGMCLLNSTKALAAVSQRFAHLDDGSTSLLLPKAIYAAVNCLFLGLGLWKCGKLGLLPTTSADWVSYLPAATNRAEVSGVPL